MILTRHPLSHLLTLARRTPMHLPTTPRAYSLLVLFALAASPAWGDTPRAVLRSARSGPWSAPATWEGGRVPGAGARVLIRAGQRVVYDVKSTQVVRAINVAGTLSFATDRDTL